MNKIWRNITNLSRRTKVAMTLLLAASILGIYEQHDVVKEIATEKPRPKLDQDFDLNPASDDFINQCMSLEHLVCVPLLYAETYLETPKVMPMEHVWTRGYGMTWSRDENDHMTIRNYKNNGRGRVAHKPPLYQTKDQDIADLQQCLRDYVYPQIKQYMKRNLTQGEFFGLCLAGYQLSGHVPAICQKLNEATTPQQVADAFITTKTLVKFGGTIKRRWVSGMLAAGYMVLRDILDADMDAFYLAKKGTLIKDEHFVCDRDTIDYVLQLRYRKTLREELAEFADGRRAIRQIVGVNESEFLLLNMPQNIVSEQSAASMNVCPQDKIKAPDKSIVKKNRKKYKSGTMKVRSTVCKINPRMDTIFNEGKD